MGALVWAEIGGVLIASSFYHEQSIGWILADETDQMFLARRRS